MKKSRFKGLLYLENVNGCTEFEKALWVGSEVYTLVMGPWFEVAITSNHVRNR